MRVAYADPPYPGLAHLYADHPDFAGEVDHAELIGRLTEGFDAWALHTSVGALRELLPLTPADTRTLAWVKGWASWKPNISPAYAWEPILISGHRRVDEARKVRDWIACHPVTGADFVGAKPPGVIEYVFQALGLEPDDELADLYPGTGAVGRTWDEWRCRPWLDKSLTAADQLELEAGAG